MAGRGIRRCLGAVFAFAIGAGLGTDLNADSPDAGTNGVVAPMRPLLQSSPAATSFLDSHPELVQPPPAEPPNLSLRPSAPPTNAPVESGPLEVTPPTSELSSEPLTTVNPLGQPEELAEHLLVVYNTNDPSSKELAEYYAAKRAIPEERVLGIATPLTEEITRAEYNDTVRLPILTYLLQKDWMARQTQQVDVAGRSRDLLVATRNEIWAMVLMRGVPLKIAPDPSDNDAMEREPQLETNAAAVDSELALLPVFGLPNGGYVPNVFFENQVGGIKRVGPDLARNIILVTRLDGPKVSDVRRMIDDTIYAEVNRLAGLAVVDTRGITDVNDGYASGDIWLRSARDALMQDGWTVKFDDKPDVLPATDPCNQVAIYLGWYHDGAIGPWVTPPNRFVPGAIAYHLHSFSAATVRSETEAWVGPLIAHGAAATMGTVYEPYLALTPHMDIFAKRLLEGDYFAEAAYASQRGLSWMVTVVGDPLYRPFRLPMVAALANAQMPHTAHDDWLRLQEVQRELAMNQIDAKTAALERAIEIPGAGTVAEEGLGDLLQRLNLPDGGSSVADAYTKALGGDVVPVDRIRVGLKLAQYYSNHGQDARAQAELDVIRELFPEESKRFGVADPLVPTNQGTPPPPSTTSTLPTVPQPPKPPRPAPMPAQ